MNSVPQMDKKLCHNMANAFFALGIYSDELDKQAQSKEILFECDAFYGIPAVVNTAFACELYLKALIMRELGQSDKPPYGHDLFSLYKGLPINICNDLAKSFTKRCKYQITLEETLKIHAQTFERWRYVYERDKSNAVAYPETLLLAAAVLKDELENNSLSGYKRTE